ncbi:hypothetical protein C4R89_11785 [Clostridioides difficile]|nr:hypothetical protein [Clostridioides difficile]MDB0440216.1 hypothetical protein [Clostridioides difficile]
MNRNILLIEPNYKNKYPPIGVMKISTYYKMLGDKVTFFKGDLKDLVINDIYDDLLKQLYANCNEVFWEEYKNDIIYYLKKGIKDALEKIPKVDDNPIIRDLLVYYRKFYRTKEYLNPNYRKYDRVGITTLFTFYWDITIETINFAKCLCKHQKDVMVGGVMASILPNEIEKETGIKPFVGALNKPGILDDNNIIIDNLPLDYSILDEIDYRYPANNSYFGYMTRGCINKCSFCAVPKLEPEYKDFISIKEQIKITNEKFGDKKDLLLLDNNVLASNNFDKIIEEIKEAGFTKDNLFYQPNEFEVAIRNLREGYNDRAYIKKIIGLYKLLLDKYFNEETKHIFSILETKKLLDIETAKKENILSCYEDVKGLFEKYYKRRPKKRIVDFNQGIDARLINDENMSKLSEIPIKPLRIAFDDWKLHDIYENAVKTAVKYGIKNLSNYLLYNYKDKPIDLYRRLKLNVDLCDELDANIYSFPMKYHPIEDPKYFKNRNFIGLHWNRKFIRAIQAILNSTKGKVGSGTSFFNEAFGESENSFYKLLYMPETFIIYRQFFKDCGLTNKWWQDFKSLNEEKIIFTKRIIEKNEFQDIDLLTNDKEILNILKYYTITREQAEGIMKNGFYNN